MQADPLTHCISAAHAANLRGQFNVAIGWCEQALRAVPDLPEAWYNLGIAYGGKGLHDHAVNALLKTAALTLNNPDAQNSVGLQLTELGALQEAEQCLQRALSIAPDFAFAYSNLGKLHEKLKRLERAEACFRKAIELQPDLAPVYANLCGILNAQNKYELAESFARKALELDPQLPAAWYNLGAALSGQKKHKHAAECFRRRLAIDAAVDFLPGIALHAMMHICDWSSLATDLPLLIQQIGECKKVVDPFHVLALTSDAAVQRRATEIFAADQYPERTELGPIAKPPRTGKIRIGYFSADFHNHATSYLIAELLELHNKPRFELIGFSFGPDIQDEMRQRVSAAFDRFIDVRTKSDKEVAQLARELGIDIAIDLKGYTEDSRTGIFAHRAAPIQVNYLGYPGTMGVSYIDYVIADRTLIPLDHQLHYSEKVVYLPNSYQVNDAKRQISDTVFGREELGLPPTGFVFCCFNNNYKIAPPTFDAWMRILGRVEGSVLWLLESNPDAVANLRKEATQRRIDPKRLVFGKSLPLPEHLARIRQADLFVDTLPCNAHTTASDALWAGLPVLTHMGESFASRVAASLLNAIGLPELVATSQEEYETLAIELAINPGQLAAIRRKLEENRLQTPLFDTPLFTKHIEAAYTAMYERYQSDLPPDHIFVES